MSDTNYTPEEKTYKDSVKRRIKGMFPDDIKPTKPVKSLFGGRSRTDVEIDKAEEGKGGTDAGPLVKKLWDKADDE
jgi:hypothetical protein